MLTGLAAFAVGAVFGAIVALLNLPAPAPPTLAGVAGIAGVTSALILVNHIKG